MGAMMDIPNKIALPIIAVVAGSICGAVWLAFPSAPTAAAKTATVRPFSSDIACKEGEMWMAIEGALHHLSECCAVKLIHGSSARRDLSAAHRIVSLGRKNLVVIGGTADIGCRWDRMLRGRE